MALYSLSRYVGTTVLLIYMDRRGVLSQRRVRVDSVEDGRLRAYCWLRRGPRVFQLDRILAFHPEGGRRLQG